MYVWDFYLRKMIRMLFVWVVTALLALCRGQNTVLEGYRLSESGYHLCVHNVTRNVTFLVMHTVPYAVTKPCGGWLPWKTCTVTLYRMTHHTEHKTVMEQVTGCCSGYEQVGRYCARPVNWSAELTAKPGSCPTADGLCPGSEDCEWDVDCPGWQKCCPQLGRFLCMEPTSTTNNSEIGGCRFNATVTVKTDYQQLISSERGILNHTRLLQAMVTGALQSDVSVYYLGSQPMHPYRTATSLLIVCDFAPSLHNVTSKLHHLLKHIQEVTSVSVQDVNECAQSALRQCSLHADCNNTVGSYRCTCHYGYIDLDSRNPGAHCTADMRVTTPTELAITSRTPGTTPYTAASNSTLDYLPRMSLTAEPLLPTTTCPPPSITSVWSANVSGTAFDVYWSSWTNQTYQVVLSTRSEIVGSWMTNQRMVEARDLQPGVLYNITVTPSSCGNQGETLGILVKTDALTLDATTRLTNIKFTADLHNTSSQAYENLTESIREEIYQSLSVEMKAMVDSGRVRIDIRSFSPGSVVVNFTIVFASSRSKDIGDVSKALLDSLMNSTKYTVDENNTSTNDFNECALGENDCSQKATCTNTWGSYSCVCLEGLVDNSPKRPGRACQENATPHITAPTTTITAPATIITASTTNVTAPKTNVTASTTNITATETIITASTTNNTAPTTNSTVPTTNVTAPKTNVTASTTNITATETIITASTTNNTAPTTNSTAPTTNVTAPKTNVTASTTNITATETIITASTTNNTAPTTNSTAPTTNVTAPKTNVTASTTNITATETIITAPTTNSTAPPTDITALKNHITAPTTNITATETNSTEPTVNFTAPTTNITPPPTNITAPKNHITAPTTNITATATNSTQSTVNFTTPTTNITATATNTTELFNFTAAPTTNISAPRNNISAPRTNITAPSANVPAPATHITEPIVPTTTNVSLLGGALSVQCRVAAITVTVSKDFLMTNKIREHTLYLGLPECTVNGENTTHAQLTVAWNECGTSLAQNETHYMTSVTLFNNMEMYTSISKKGQVPRIRLEAPIKCTYKKSMLISADFGFMGIDMIKDIITGSGSPQVTLQLMGGTMPLPNNHSFSSDEAVVVEVSLNYSSEQMKVVINKCWATPTQNSEDANRVTFLENSCSRNNYTKVLMNGNSTTARVSVQIFSVVNVKVIYVHCLVQVCVEIGSDTCVPDCLQRTAQSSKTIGNAISSSRALLRSDDESIEEGFSTLYLAGISCLGIGLTLFVVIGFVCIFYFHRNRIGHYNFSAKPKQENFTYIVFNT
ncbi:uromodulin-like 1 [Spinachia spinachia]